MKTATLVSSVRVGLKTRPITPAVRFLATAAEGPSTRYKEPTHISSSTSPATAEALSKGSDYLLGVYARPDFVISHGKGSHIWDTDGRKFLDFSSGIAVNAFGHADDGITKCIAEQAGKILHTSNVYHNEWAPELGELLVKTTQAHGGLGFAPGTDSSTSGAKVFYSNSGTEANEGALKIARKVGKERWAATTGKSWDSPDCTKTRIACFKGSFHGRSMGALSVTSNPKYQLPFAPLIPGIDVGQLNDLGGLQTLVTDDTCAVIVEPIQGEGGINVADVKWLRALRKRCDETGAVLIFDEIQSGLFRSGTLWAHSGMPVDCHPDIVTMAKPLANGYPIGAVLMRDSVAATMTPGTHGTTFGGSPLACAIGHHVLSRLVAQQTINHVAETSKHLTDRLKHLPTWFPSILQNNIRGRGLILGLGFHQAEHPGQVVKMARERGVFVLTAGHDAIRFVPSLNVDRADVDFAVDVIESCLSRI